MQFERFPMFTTIRHEPYINVSHARITLLPTHYYRLEFIFNLPTRKKYQMYLIHNFNVIIKYNVQCLYTQRFFFFIFFFVLYFIFVL